MYIDRIIVETAVKMLMRFLAGYWKSIRVNVALWIYCIVSLLQKWNKTVDSQHPKGVQSWTQLNLPNDTPIMMRKNPDDKWTTCVSKPSANSNFACNIISVHVFSHTQWAIKLVIASTTPKLILHVTSKPIKMVKHSWQHQNSTSPYC